MVYESFFLLASSLRRRSIVVSEKSFCDAEVATAETPSTWASASAADVATFSVDAEVTEKHNMNTNSPNVFCLFTFCMAGKSSIV